MSEPNTSGNWRTQTPGCTPQDTARCRQCGTDDPMADKVGWLELRYEYVPEPLGRFCGGICASQWLRAAQERLFGAVFGERRAGPPS